MKNGKTYLTERKWQKRKAVVAEFFGGLMVGSSVSIFIFAGFLSGYNIFIH